MMTLKDPAAYCRQANRETFICVQIEDREAVDRVEEIAATPGVDILFVGPADLAQSYGVPFQYDHDLVQSAMRRVAEVAKVHGKAWGTPAVDPTRFERYARMGARFLSVGSDLGTLLQGWREKFRTYRELADKAAT
jgi:2-keto-3-deoxy-L-rhamnonate aldolase RhmA